MAQILGQINRYFPSPDFNPFSYEEQSGASHSMDISVDKYFEDARDSTEQIGQRNYLLKPEKRSVGRPPGKKKKRSKQSLARHHHLSADMSTFGTPTQPDISDVFDADGSIWAHHCCAAWSAGVCQTDSYDLENVDKAAFKAISEVPLALIVVALIEFLPKLLIEFLFIGWLDWLALFPLSTACI